MIYEIAEKRIDIQNRYNFTTIFCQEYLSADQTSAVDLTASLTVEEFQTEKCGKKNYSDGYIENIALYRKICNQFPEYDRFLMHGVVVEYNGEAYIFTGKSGSGKSTHAMLWLRHVKGARILNGDKPIIAMTGKELVAYGTPWNGKEGMGYNGKAPLKGICLIEQAAENRIERVAQSQMSAKIFGQLLIPKNSIGVEKTLAFADRLVALPYYLLRCTISEEAVKTSFEALTKKSYEESKK